MIPAHYMIEVELTFQGLTARERAIYQTGADHGKSIKADECQLIISRLEMERHEFNEVAFIS